MHEPSVARILSNLTPSDRVVDVGGWARPFNRANVVVDMMPYESRGVFGSQGGDTEYFTSKTWLQWDLCARQPFPFEDKHFDFVICSHTLEDIRDPVGVCSELMRIGKRGYIETPSRLLESCRGVESRKYAGYWHHRWLVETAGDVLLFIAKFPFIDHHWKYYLPAEVGSRLSEEERIVRLFWVDRFEFLEKTFPFDAAAVRKEQEDFVRRHRPAAGFRYKMLGARERYRESNLRKRIKPLLDPLERPIKWLMDRRGP